MTSKLIIVGIDEVGRGSWAGPLVASAVILNKPIIGLKDSKLLTKQERNKLFDKIKTNALAIGVGWADVSLINEKGLSSAITFAMGDALKQINTSYDEIIIDGNVNFLGNNPKSNVLVKADNIFPCVSAASIIAKVTRDNWMNEISKEYPDYGFERHVGYGTKLHIERLRVFGPCAIHRMNYAPIKALSA